MSSSESSSSIGSGSGSSWGGVGAFDGVFFARVAGDFMGGGGRGGVGFGAAADGGFEGFGTAALVGDDLGAKKLEIVRWPLEMLDFGV